MENTVLIKSFVLPEPDEREILRYMGGKEPSEEVKELLQECLAESKDAFSAKVCYSEFKISVCGDTADFGFASVKSRSLSSHLHGCGKAVIFAASVGLGIDRLIRRYGRISPARALCMQAIGTERIEALCDAFCEELQREAEERKEKTVSRFSAGYGDLPLSFQTDIFKALKCERSIGISLNKSLLMSPSKSVTAIVGITEE